MTAWIWALTSVTARQLVRDRILWILVLYAVACATLVPMASAMSLGAGSRGAWDAGLVIQWWLLMAAAMWCGIRIVPMDLHRGTARVFVAPPLPVSAWALGRWTGGLLILAILVLGTSAIWSVTALALQLKLTATYPLAMLMLWLQTWVGMTAAAALGTRTMPTVAATASAIWIGLGTLATESQNALQERSMDVWAATVNWVVPNMDQISLHADLVLGSQVGLPQVLRSVTLALCWTAALGIAGLVSLQTRDLT